MLTLKHLPGTIAVRMYEGKRLVEVDEALYACGEDPPHYPVPAIIYGFNEYWEIWEYTGQPDDIKSSYPTYYRKVARVS